jgi:hypothetical protein
MDLISVPVAVYNGLFEWQLDLFWHRHKELYGKNAFQKAKAIVIRRNSLTDKRCEEFKWNNDVPHSLCESFADYDINLSKYENPHPINIQIGLLQIFDEFKDDEQIIELLDCDMFHIKEHPVLEIEDNTFFVADIYENWHLFSLTSKKHIIKKYLKNEELYYNGGFVPIIGKIKTFKKVINTWIEIHKDILGRFPAKEHELTRWWAGMYSFQAACNVEKIKMVTKDYCYIVPINNLENSHYIAHYSCDQFFFNKKNYPIIDYSKFPKNNYYDIILNWHKKSIAGKNMHKQKMFV